MILNVGQISLIDFIGQLERNEITINRDYQRGSGVWPDSARTYFIDTILEGYPFPKIYLYQVFNDKSKRPIKEIVDGQQRVTTIQEFFTDDFKLTASSKKYSGKRYSDLDEDIKIKFQSYQIEVSTILSAARPELLEMFRRINAYTAPLSAAEKRHSLFQGSFKWFIVEQADDFSPTLEELEILSQKELARMADSEFIADMVVSLDRGITEKSAKNIDGIYKLYEDKFPHERKYSKVLSEFFNFLKNELEPVHGTFIMKSYVINSLFCAFAHAKYGIPNASSLTRLTPDSKIKFDIKKINRNLLNLADAHERKDESGRYGDYVKTCISSTTKLNQRQERFKILLKSITA